MPPPPTPSPSPGVALRRILAGGYLVCGVRTDLVGFGYRDPRTGIIDGFEPELCRAIAERLGVEADILEVETSDRISALQDRRADLIAAAFAITDERRALARHSSCSRHTSRPVKRSSSDVATRSRPTT